MIVLLGGNSKFKSMESLKRLILNASAFVFLFGATQAQELDCQVWIEADQVQTQEQQIFQDMQVALTEFMNNQVWTDDEYELEERIKCVISIRLTAGNVQSGSYTAVAQVQSMRPVYGSDYESVVFHFIDQFFNFSYRPGMNLNFNVNNYTNNLTSMLGFYAYMILGYDYDSFSELGGSFYFEQARNIVNIVPQGVSDGWNEQKGPNNRWHLMNQASNAQMEALRKSYYEYHRKGMDKFTETPEETQQIVLGFLKAAQEARRLVPLNIYVESIIMAKREEIIEIYKPVSDDLKEEVMMVLRVIDPTNMSKYQAIMDK